ncbi:MAG TPA: hypothetical protein VGP72_01150 [Planctomycetota bacterium]|jgi:hypothetical protein
MESNEIQSTLFFPTEGALPSAATVPNLITLFDTDLLGALGGINGSKPGIWHTAPPYDEDDRYQPFREDVPFESWSLGYNQAELLALTGYSNTLVFANDTMIVDSAASQKALLAADETREPESETSYAELPDFPSLLKKIGWALMAVGPERNYALFVTSPDKLNYIELLERWCHKQGRTYLNAAIQDEKLVIKAVPAPPESRQGAVHENFLQMMHKLGQMGIGANEARQHLEEVFKQMGESEPRP